MLTMKSMPVRPADLVKPADIPYQHVKQRDNFINGAKFKTREAFDARYFNSLTKKPKPGASENYPLNRWIEIKGSAQIKPVCATRLQHMVVLSGELFRLLDANQTKYRILRDEKHRTLISKEIKSAQSFRFHIENIALIKNKYKEGMGRNILGKYIYLDDDFHFDNSLIDENNYFNVIDHDRCFWPWAHKLFHAGKDTEPKLSVDDYDNLPLLKNYNPGNWEWDHAAQSRAYSQELAKQEFFNNEKHFASIKCLVTNAIQLELVKYHIPESKENDRETILKLLEERLCKFSDTVAQSKPLMKYLNDNCVDIIRALIYELNDFFEDNRHYKEKIAHLGEAACIIKSYSNFLQKMGKKSLTDDEHRSLIAFEKALHNQYPSAKQTVCEFYTKQKTPLFYSLREKSAAARAKKKRTFAAKQKETKIIIDCDTKEQPLSEISIITSDAIPSTHIVIPNNRHHAETSPSFATNAYRFFIDSSSSCLGALKSIATAPFSSCLRKPKRP